MRMMQAIAGKAGIAKVILPILVLGAFFKDIVRHVHGVISIGPFACLPSRIIESILTKESAAAGNRRLESLENAEELMAFDKLPFLSIESDGNPFPQIITSKMEAFCLQVERLHATLASRR